MGPHSCWRAVAWKAAGVTSHVYRERLVPRWWAWLLALSLVAMVAIAYGAALGDRAGWILGIGGVVLAGWLLWITAPTIVVTEDELLIAAARLPLSVVDRVEVVQPSQILSLRGPGSDARLFVSLRPWAANSGVIVHLDDPQDPHPAWLLSTNHPDQVAAAIAGTMGHSSTSATEE